MNIAQVKKSESLFGTQTVEMLKLSHEDALWMLENLGVGCSQPDILEGFRRYEADGKAIIYENKRVFITRELVQECLVTVPGVDQFFVPRNSFFIGGTAPYIYDDTKGEGGVIPTSEHVAQIAKIAEKSSVVAGMGRGVKLKDEIEQMNIMVQNCSKPIYTAITSDKSLERALEIHKQSGKIMALFCLTRPSLEVNENFSEHFVKVVRAGLPVCVSAMPMAGISAPYCYNGVISMTHAEVLFGICTSQILNPGHLVVHAGFPTIADPSYDYNPNYGLKSHHMLNIFMSHLNLMLDIPTFQSGGTTNEEHVTEKALEDAKNGQALAVKYGFHMIRHPFAFLRHLVDFSINKLEHAIEIAENIKPEDAPEVEMPVYDPRGMESVQRTGLGMYMNDSLTTANLGKIFKE
ncbi:Trimethylamine methyltransferase family protein [Desulfonema limicola]|uniref:Trimethylamine methyltransferase family protein n=1 Tax=Desulfonema limicola TaxID=45656 RepID=A0A975B8K9_9BACT|nr:trimethylamine methyltransferase family protein [Desulfonema limicola]QTA80926.1 Trimethylamine methyltransferase family protein [Desulfonema limicola]